MLKLNWRESQWKKTNGWEPEDSNCWRSAPRGSGCTNTPTHRSIQWFVTQGVNTEDTARRDSCKNETKGAWNCICKVQLLRVSPNLILFSWLPVFIAKLLSKNKHKANLREKV